MVGELFINPDNLLVSDIYKLFITYLSQLAVRFIAIMIHYPLLSRFGYGMNFSKAILLTLGGVKGVISTALAVIAANNLATDQIYRAWVLYLTIGITFLTLTFNPFLLKIAEMKFHVDTLSTVQENLLLRVTSAILHKTYAKIKKLEQSKEFPLVKWSDVLKIAGPRELVVAIMKQSSIGKTVLKENQKETAEILINKYCANLRSDNNALLSEMRRRFYNSLKGIY